MMMSSRTPGVSNENEPPSSLRSDKLGVVESLLEGSVKPSENRSEPRVARVWNASFKGYVWAVTNGKHYGAQTRLYPLPTVRCANTLVERAQSASLCSRIPGCFSESVRYVTVPVGIPSPSPRLAALEISVRTIRNNVRRLLFTTSHVEPVSAKTGKKKTRLHVKLPLFPVAGSKRNTQIQSGSRPALNIPSVRQQQQQQQRMDGGWSWCLYCVDVVYLCRQWFGELPLCVEGIAVSGGGSDHQGISIGGPILSEKRICEDDERGDVVCTDGQRALAVVSRGLAGGVWLRRSDPRVRRRRLGLAQKGEHAPLSATHRSYMYGDEQWAVNVCRGVAQLSEEHGGRVTAADLYTPVKVPQQTQPSQPSQTHRQRNPKPRHVRKRSERKTTRPRKRSTRQRTRPSEIPAPPTTPSRYSYDAFVRRNAHAPTPPRFVPQSVELPERISDAAESLSPRSSPYKELSAPVSGRFPSAIPRLCRKGAFSPDLVEGLGPIPQPLRPLSNDDGVSAMARISQSTERTAPAPQHQPSNPPSPSQDQHSSKELPSSQDQPSHDQSTSSRSRSQQSRHRTQSSQKQPADGRRDRSDSNSARSHSSQDQASSKVQHKPSEGLAEVTNVDLMPEDINSLLNDAIDSQQEDAKPLAISHTQSTEDPVQATHSHDDLDGLIQAVQGIDLSHDTSPTAVPAPIQDNEGERASIDESSHSQAAAPPYNPWSPIQQQSVHYVDAGIPIATPLQKPPEQLYDAGKYMELLVSLPSPPSLPPTEQGKLFDPILGEYV